jgi:hypothetical protein
LTVRLVSRCGDHSIHLAAKWFLDGVYTPAHSRKKVKAKGKGKATADADESEDSGSDSDSGENGAEGGDLDGDDLEATWDPGDVLGKVHALVNQVCFPTVSDSSSF